VVVDLAEEGHRVTGKVKSKSVTRFFRHLLSHHGQVTRHFSVQALQNIERAIHASEQKHQGEIRFVVEAGLHPHEIIGKKSPRARAIELFSHLHIWDTEHNNGVLLYLLLADRDIEIVADRGIYRLVGHAKWNAMCNEMETMFRQGQFEAGVLQGIAKISAELEAHFPLVESKNKQSKKKRNELPDKPLVL
jgi:uncharacterized membrane protein